MGEVVMLRRQRRKLGLYTNVPGYTIPRDMIVLVSDQHGALQLVTAGSLSEDQLQQAKWQTVEVDGHDWPVLALAG